MSNGGVDHDDVDTPGRQKIQRVPQLPDVDVAGRRHRAGLLLPRRDFVLKRTNSGAVPEVRGCASADRVDILTHGARETLQHRRLPQLSKVVGVAVQAKGCAKRTDILPFAPEPQGTCKEDVLPQGIDRLQQALVQREHHQFYAARPKHPIMVQPLHDAGKHPHVRSRKAKIEPATAKSRIEVLHHRARIETVVGAAVAENEQTWPMLFDVDDLVHGSPGSEDGPEFQEKVIRVEPDLDDAEERQADQQAATRLRQSPYCGASATDLRLFGQVAIPTDS